MKRISLIAACAILFASCSQGNQNPVKEKEIVEVRDTILIEDESIQGSVEHSGIEYNVVNNDSVIETIILNDVSDTGNYELSEEQKQEIVETFEIKDDELTNDCSKNGECKIKTFSVSNMNGKFNGKYKLSGSSIVKDEEAAKARKKNKKKLFTQTGVRFKRCSSGSSDLKKACEQIGEKCTCILLVRMIGEKKFKPAKQTFFQEKVPAKDKRKERIDKYYVIKDADAKKISKYKCSCSQSGTL